MKNKREVNFGLKSGPAFRLESRAGMLRCGFKNRARLSSMTIENLGLNCAMLDQWIGPENQAQ